MMTLLAVVVVAAASAHLGGNLLSLRGGDRALLGQRVDLIGGLVVLSVGLLVALWGLGVSVGPRSWLLARGGGHGALEANGQLVGVWLMAAGAVMVIGARFKRSMSGRWAGLAMALIGVGLVGGALWLGFSPARVGVGITSYAASALTSANAVLFAGGLAGVALGLLLVSDDESLTHASWLALGLVLAAAAMSLVMAYGGPYWDMGLYLPLVDGRGVPVEIVFSTSGAHGEVTKSGVAALNMTGAETLGTGVVALVLVSLAAGVVGSFHRDGGRMLFGATGVLGLVLVGFVVNLAGEVSAPTLEGMLQAIEGAGVSRDVLVGMPAITSEGPVYMHTASLLPTAALLWIVSVLAGYRALGPSAVQQGGAPCVLRSFDAGNHLLAGRDAMMLGALLFWLGLGVGMLASYEVTGRFVSSYKLGSYVGVALLAGASVIGWHAALGRPTRAAFGTWVVLPAMALVLAALVMVSGVFTSGPFSFVSVLP